VVVLAAMVVASLMLAAGVAANPVFDWVRANHGSYPGALRGPLGGLGLRISSGGFVALLLVICGCYLSILRLAGSVRPRDGVAAIVALHVIFMLAPPLLSSDVFNYLGYGRLGVVHGLNPYHHALAAAPGDASFPYIGWRHSTSAYGPLFTLATYALAPLSLSASLWLLKVLTAAASLGCVLLVWRCAERLGRDPLRAALYFGLNPVVLVFAVGGAHNDLLMVLFALGGIYLVLRGAERASAAAIVGATAVKTSAAVLLPFTLLGSRRRGRAFIYAAAAAAAAFVVSIAVFGIHLFSVVRVIGDEAHQGSLHSIPRSLSEILGGRVGVSTLRPVATAVFLAILAWLLWRVWQGSDWLTDAGWAIFALLVTTTYLLPWYTVWLLPIAALAPSSSLRIWALLLCAFVIGLRIPLLA
jgi:alpha-1,6-mannosyltransferase